MAFCFFFFLFVCLFESVASAQVTRVLKFFFFFLLLCADRECSTMPFFFFFCLFDCLPMGGAELTCGNVSFR